MIKRELRNSQAMTAERSTRDKAAWTRLDLADADIRLYAKYVSQAEAHRLIDLIYQKTRWQQDKVRLFGRVHLIPRLHQWYADPGLSYRWSGLRLQPESWFDELGTLRDRIANAIDVPLNSVLVNLYRDGQDCMGWHADDEPELGEQPVIASLSLGAERDFLLRRSGKSGASPKRNIRLTDGSLLVMAGDTQRFWQHALPRRRRITEPRINLTFRRVLPVGCA